MSTSVSKGVAFPDIPLDRVVLLLGARGRALQAEVDRCNHQLRARRVARLFDGVTLARAGLGDRLPEQGLVMTNSVWQVANGAVDAEQSRSRALLMKDPEADCDLELICHVLLRDRSVLVQVNQAAVAAHALLLQVPGTVDFSCPRGTATGRAAEEVLTRSGRWQQVLDPAASFRFRMAWTPSPVSPDVVAQYLPDTGARVDAWSKSRALKRLIKTEREQGSKRPLATLERELSYQLNDPTNEVARVLQQERDLLMTVLAPTAALAEQMTSPMTREPQPSSEPLAAPEALAAS